MSIYGESGVGGGPGPNPEGRATNDELDAELAGTVPTEEDRKVAAIVEAWNNAGPMPALHEREKQRLRKRWPRLYYAVRALAEGQ